MTFWIVMPCYNEEKRLPLSEIEYFLKLNTETSILFVNDGSKDNTFGILKDFCKITNNAKFIDLLDNKGKAEAVRIGFLHILAIDKNTSIGFADADLATPLQELVMLDNILKSENKDFVFGSRWKRIGSVIERNPFRHYFGRVFATIVSLMLNLPVYDTQCGAKVFSNTIIKDIFNDPFISPWFFDVEIFARYINKFGEKKLFHKVLEVPLNNWIEKGDSRLGKLDFLKVPFELNRIRKKYKI